MAELWDVYDENAERTGRTMSRGEPVSGDYMLCVHIYVYDTQGRFLIQKRAMNKESHPGEWDVTGGAVLSGEESINGAIRETFEEVGILLTPDDLCFAGRLKKKKSFVDIYFAMKDFDIAGCVLQTEEVSDIRLVELDELIDLERNSRGRDEKYMSIVCKAAENIFGQVI